MNAREKAERILALVNEAGAVEPTRILVTHDVMEYQVRVGSCGDFDAMVKAAKAKTVGGRLLQHPPRRFFDALAADGLVITHDCLPHLACWGAS